MMNLLCTCMQRAVRSTTRTPLGASTRYYIHGSSAPRSRAVSMPKPKEGLATPVDFLTRMGRSMSEQESKVGSDWQKFWRMRGDAFKEAGVGVKERKYILRQMEYFRQGREIKEIEAKPPKVFRGRGPKVQKGMRRP